MRLPIAAAVLALALAAPYAAPALAQTVPEPAASPAPSPAPSPAFACAPRQANLGGIGRASVVAFTGAIFGDRVCATVANLALDGFTAQIAASAPDDALVVAPLGNGAGATLLLAGDALSLVPAGPAVAGDAATTAGTRRRAATARPHRSDRSSSRRAGRSRISAAIPTPSRASCSPMRDSACS